MNGKIAWLRVFLVGAAALFIHVDADPYDSMRVEDFLPTMPPAQFAPVIATKCQPKIELSDLRLAWTRKDHTFVELTCDAVALSNGYMEKYADTLGTFEYDADFRGEKLDWVLSQVKEKFGDEYWLYCVNDGTITQRKLVAIVGEYSELDNSVTFTGRVEEPDASKGDNIYIAFGSRKKPTVTVVTPKPLDPSDREAVRKWMAPDPDMKTAQVLETYKWPNSDITLATVRVDLSDILYCLSPSHGRLWKVNFAGHETAGGFPVAQRPGDFCYPMNNTTIYVLPDFNGDGWNELLVNSTATCLFDLSTHETGKLIGLRGQGGLPLHTLPTKKVTLR